MTGISSFPHEVINVFQTVHKDLNMKNYGYRTL